MTAHRTNFTKSGIAALPIPSAGDRAVYRDTKTSGLQLRVTLRGVKTFSVFRRTKGGRPERLTLGRFPAMSVEQARRAAAQVNAAIEDRRNPAELRRTLRGERTFAELFGEYLERHSRPNKRTWREDESKYRQYLSRVLGGKKASTVSRTDVAGIHSTTTRSGHPTTANRVLALVSSVFSWGISAGLVESNPSRGIRRNRERSRDRFLHSEELPRFFRALAAEPNETVRDFFLLCLLTGARRENVLSIRWGDISLDRAEWRIPRTKNGLPQVVALSKPALGLLRGRRTTARGEFVFPSQSESGHIIETRRAWERLFDRDELAEITRRLQTHGDKFHVDPKESLHTALSGARRRATDLGIELSGVRLTDLRLHDLRRTLGSWQAMLGASLAIIGKSLNHKSVAATLVYARLETDPVRDSVERATAAILDAAGDQTFARAKLPMTMQRVA
jgi:integrase